MQFAESYSSGHWGWELAHYTWTRGVLLWCYSLLNFVSIHCDVSLYCLSLVIRANVHVMSVWLLSFPSITSEFVTMCYVSAAFGRGLRSGLSSHSGACACRPSLQNFQARFEWSNVARLLIPKLLSNELPRSHNRGHANSNRGTACTYE